MLPQKNVEKISKVPWRGNDEYASIQLLAGNIGEGRGILLEVIPAPIDRFSFQARNGHCAERPRIHRETRISSSFSNSTLPLKEGKKNGTSFSPYPFLIEGH